MISTYRYYDDQLLLLNIHIRQIILYITYIRVYEDDNIIMNMIFKQSYYNYA